MSRAGKREGPASDVAARRARARRWCLAAAVAAAGLGVALFVSGGGISIGRVLTIHNPTRPLALMALALMGYVWAGGRFRAVGAFGLTVARQVSRSIARLMAASGLVWAAITSKISIKPGVVVAVLVVGTTCVDLRYGAHAVGGSDSYGYLGQAHLWLTGNPVQRQPFVEAVPLRGARWLFAPLGFRPADDSTDIVPTYAPGLPMVMAAAMKVAGYRAAFYVVPISAGLAILATYLLGRRVHSPWAGVVGAWLLGTSPTFLMQSLVPPMSDVPVTTAWALAFAFLLGRGRWSMWAAGVMTGLGVLIRLNLAPLAVIPGFWSVAAAWRDRLAGRARWWMKPIAFAAGIVPLAITAAASNNILYGSPFRTGYGSLDGMFTRQNVLPNIRLYAQWFTETQTPLVWLGVAAILLPLPFVWSRRDQRGVVLGWAVFVLALWFEYCLYAVWDAWWYLRFLLPVYPFVLIGFGQVLVAAGRRHRLLAMASTALVLLLGWRGVTMAADRSAFAMKAGESKYAMSGRVVRAATEPSSVIFSMLHSGTLRLYGGRMTLRYDYLADDELDRTVDWLSDHGVHSYALLEDFEVEKWRTGFGTANRLGPLDWNPILDIDGPSHMRLYDLNSKTESPSVVVRRDPIDLEIAPPIPIRGFHIRK